MTWTQREVTQLMRVFCRHIAIALMVATFLSGWKRARERAEVNIMDTKLARFQETLPDLTKAAGFIAGVIGTLGAGAGLMYFFDPIRGSARRAQLRDQATKLFHKSGTEFERTVRDLEHRAEGLYADVRTQITTEKPVGDSKLEARIHTRLGRVATFPRMLRVMSLSGDIVLGGFAPIEEVEKIVKAVSEVSGVKTVENRIEVPLMAEAAAR